MLEDLKQEKYIRTLEMNIENEVRKSISESQKEYYLREKMKVIQDERRKGQEGIGHRGTAEEDPGGEDAAGDGGKGFGGTEPLRLPQHRKRRIGDHPPTLIS